MKKFLFGLVVLAAVLFGAATVSAETRVSVRFGYYSPPPIVYMPPPVVYVPPPSVVYVQPPVVYQVPTYTPPPVYIVPQHQAPICYTPPAYIYGRVLYPAPCPAWRLEYRYRR